MTKAPQKSHEEPFAAPKTAEDCHHLVKFWGVRGTLPTPGSQTVRYGGNTACVEVLVKSGTESLSLVLDAGSGIADFGDEALNRGVRQFFIFLSHAHYDHIMGLTRFAPLFRKDCQITFFGRSWEGTSLQEILRRFFSYPFFPVEFAGLGAGPRLVFRSINEGECIHLGPARITACQLNHPQGATAYRVTHNELQTSLVYATDHEHGTVRDDALIAFAQKSDLLLYDSTFSEHDYEKYKGWGHSTPKHGAHIAHKAGAKAFGLFHHDPTMADEELEKTMLPQAQGIFAEAFLCREREVFDLRTHSSAARITL